MRLEVVDRIKGVIHDLWPSAEVHITPTPFIHFSLEFYRSDISGDYIILAETNGFVDQGRSWSLINMKHSCCCTVWVLLT